MVISKEDALFKTRPKPKVNVHFLGISLFSKSSWIKTTASGLSYELGVNGEKIKVCRNRDIFNKNGHSTFHTGKPGSFRARLNYVTTHHHPPPSTTTNHHPGKPGSFRVRLNYATTHHDPPSPTTIYYYQPPPNTIHLHLPPAKYIHHHPPPAKIYPPLPTISQKMDHHPAKVKIYSHITSFRHCFNSFFFSEMQYSFP